MTPAYAEAMLKHLIEHAGDPRIAKVETFAEAGAVGREWGTCGVKVILQTGQAAWVGIQRGHTDAPAGYQPPDAFDPAHFAMPSSAFFGTED